MGAYHFPSNFVYPSSINHQLELSSLRERTLCQIIWLTVSSGRVGTSVIILVLFRAFLGLIVPLFQIKFDDITVMLLSL